MLPITAAQKYRRAAAQAANDMRRKRHDAQLFDVGSLTLPELRGLMDISQRQLLALLDEQTGTSVSKGQLSRIESGSRPMPNHLFKAIHKLIQRRTDGWNTNNSDSKPLSDVAAGPTSNSPISRSA